MHRNLILKKYGSLGKYFLHTIDQDLYIFDDISNDDYIIKTKFNASTQNHRLYSQNFGTESSTRVNNLVRSIRNQVHQSNIEEFELSASQIQALKDTTSLIQGTHLRFFSDLGKLKVTVFNYRQYVHDTNPISEQHMFISELTVNNQLVKNVDFSIRSSTFAKLIPSDYQVECGDNNIVSFVSLDEDFEFLIRDQLIQEPLIKFTNEQLGKEIVLLLQPKS